MVSRQTVTLANSIVGVSVLAMPFCFKQCGIILATLMLMLGAVMTRMICYFLLKAGTITRRRTYEMLAWHTFGQGGKFIVEISIIGFLIGTLIAFFVVMGDLGPEIVSEIFDVENNSSLRNIIMTALSLFVALPLGLLRNIDSLSSVSTASVLFYVFLVCKILGEGLGPLFSGAYLDRIDYWRPAGVLQCIPIFSMALSCQTQIFGIYESLPEPSLHKMNEIVKQAVTICTVFYFCIGFFGYIAFSHQSFGGNILMTFSPSWTTQLIKTCFLMSIVFSVPLVVFPCRASLHSLIFRRVQMHHSLHDVSINYIPEAKLKVLTIGIIGFTLVVGILIPNIELVLGLVGSTTGTVICVIFPSIMFIRVTSKHTTERLLAQVLFFTGVVMMVVSTYATLYAVEQAQVNESINDQPLRVTEIINSIKEGEKGNNIPVPDKPVVEKADFKVDFKFEPKKTAFINSSSKPRVQDEQVNVIQVEDKEQVKMKDSVNSKVENTNYAGKSPQDNNKENNNIEKRVDVKTNEVNQNQDRQEQQRDAAPKANENNVVQSGAVKQENGVKQKTQVDDSIVLQQIVAEGKAKKSIGADENSQGLVGGSEQKDKKLVNEGAPAPEAVGAKDQQEGENEAKSSDKEKDMAAALLKKLEEHEENQKKFLEEQRQMLAELKEHHAQDVQRQKADEEKVQDEQQNGEGGAAVGGGEVIDKENQIKEKKPDLTVGKEEVIQQEKIIEKLSENIAKEQQNAKLIEKLEEGLNKEIKKSEAEVKDEKIKLPQPVPSDNDLNSPIVVGPEVGRVLKKIEPKPQDPPLVELKSGKKNLNSAAGLHAIPHEENNNNNSKRMLKPIPIQMSETKVQEQSNVNEGVKVTVVKVNNIPAVGENSKDEKINAEKEPKVAENPKEIASMKLEEIVKKKVDRDI